MRYIRKGGIELFSTVDNYRTGRGKFIVFEGVEGCGKTTGIELARVLCERISPARVVVTREPGGTELGLQLRQLLLDCATGEPIQDTAELLLYAADRAQHVEGFLKPHLGAGAIVLCDRFTDSTVAYQGYGRGLSLSLIDQVNQLATGGLSSDLTLWLDVDVEVGLARKRRVGAADRIEQADLDFHRRVQQGYAELAKLYPHRIVRVDASRTQEEVAGQIETVLIDRFKLWSEQLALTISNV